MKEIMQLGKMAVDKITGFKGVVVGRCVYLSGCNQLLLVPRVAKDGSYKCGQWFDEQRVDFVGSKVVVLNNSKSPGFDTPGPNY